MHTPLHKPYDLNERAATEGDEASREAWVESARADGKLTRAVECNYICQVRRHRGDPERLSCLLVARNSKLQRETTHVVGVDKDKTIPSSGADNSLPHISRQLALLEAATQREVAHRHKTTTAHHRRDNCQHQSVTINYSPARVPTPRPGKEERQSPAT